VRRGAASWSSQARSSSLPAAAACAKIPSAELRLHGSRRPRPRGRSACGLACGGELLRPAGQGHPLQGGPFGVAAAAYGRVSGRGPGGVAAGPDRQDGGGVDRRAGVSGRVRVLASGALGRGRRPLPAGAVAVPGLGQPGSAGGRLVPRRAAAFWGAVRRRPQGHQHGPLPVRPRGAAAGPAGAGRGRR
jgi:hypothetical protein